MKPGIYPNLTNEEYHSGPGLSRSRLARLLDGTPLDFHAAPPVEETAAMRLGTAAHLAILEPDRFLALVRPLPKWDMRTNAGKAARAAWDEENPGKIPVPEADYDCALQAAKLIRAKKGPATALREGKAELSIYWNDGAETLKSRPDFLDLDRGIAVDVKTTTRDLDDRQVVRILVDQHAALQASMVTQGVLALTGQRVSSYLLIVRLDAPVDMRLVQVGGFGPGEPLEWLEYGDAQFATALRLYRECSASGVWPGWADRGVTYAAAPEWVRHKTEKMTLASGLVAAESNR